MSTPLFSSDLAEATRASSILAVERREDTMRDTASHAHALGQLIGSLAGLLSVTAPHGSWVVPATDELTYQWHGFWGAGQS